MTTCRETFAASPRSLAALREFVSVGAGEPPWENAPDLLRDGLVDPDFGLMGKTSDLRPVTPLMLDASAGQRMTVPAGSERSDRRHEYRPRRHCGAPSGPSGGAVGPAGRGTGIEPSDHRSTRRRPFGPDVLRLLRGLSRGAR
jgi:hypothetical protein